MSADPKPLNSRNTALVPYEPHTLPGEKRTLAQKAASLSVEIASMEDATLQKIFAAIFDDGQGENARDAFVRYCRANDRHPSEMHVLAGNSLEQRLWEMVERQQTMIHDANLTHDYLRLRIETEIARKTRRSGG